MTRVEQSLLESILQDPRYEYNAHTRALAYAVTEMALRSDDEPADLKFLISELTKKEPLFCFDKVQWHLWPTIHEQIGEVFRKNFKGKSIRQTLIDGTLDNIN